MLGKNRKSQQVLKWLVSGNPAYCQCKQYSISGADYSKHNSLNEVISQEFIKSHITHKINCPDMFC